MTILVVDDDVDFASSMATVLEDEGHRALIANDADHSLDLARAHRVDAVLLDLILPDVDGFEIARRLRDGVVAASSIIILITGVTSVAVATADAAGIDFILHKPISAAELTGLIRHLQKSPRKVSPTRDLQRS